MPVQPPRRHDLSTQYRISYLEFDAALLELVGVGLELDAGLLVRRRRRLKVGVEQRVDQGGLAQARLANAQDVEREPALHRLVHQLQEFLSGKSGDRVEVFRGLPGRAGSRSRRVRRG